MMHSEFFGTNVVTDFVSPSTAIKQNIFGYKHRRFLAKKKVDIFGQKIKPFILLVKVRHKFQSPSLQVQPNPA
jgi:hypothetical protein